MKRLELVPSGEVGPHVEQLPDDLVLLVAVGEVQRWGRLVYGPEHLDDQDAVVGDEGASALADDVRMRHPSALQTSAM